MYIADVLKMIYLENIVKPDTESSHTRKSHWGELLKSAYSGEIEKVKCLLLKNHDFNSTDDNGVTALMLASLKGHMVLVKFLLDKGADCHAVTRHNFNALMFATRNGHHLIVVILLSKDVNYKLINSQGDNPLMIASVRGHLKIVELLLGLNAEVNVINNKGHSALMSATVSELELVVKILLLHKADCNTVDKQNNSCLIVAAEKGNVEIVKLLLDHKADCNVVNTDGYTALKCVAKNGNLQIVKLLLERETNCDFSDVRTFQAFSLANNNNHLYIANMISHKVKGANKTIFRRYDHCVNENKFGTRTQMGMYDSSLNLFILAIRSENAHLMKQYFKNIKVEQINLSDKTGYNALMIATIKGRTDVVKLLLGKRANVNLVNMEGFSALMIAAQEGHLEIAKMLTQNNADVNLVSYSTQKSALMIATLKGLVNIVSLLLTTTININAVNIHGVNALMYASCIGNCDIMQLLLKTEIRLDQVNTNGNSALHLAVLGGHAQAVELLLSKGCNINDPGGKGRSPLAQAVVNGHEDVVFILLKHNADIRYVSTIGLTCLMIAAIKGYVKIVQHLLHNGADVNKTTSDGDTALMLAVYKGHADIVQLLLEAGALFAPNDEQENALCSIADSVDANSKIIPPNAETCVTENNFLSLAVDRGYPEVVDVLLKFDVKKLLIKTQGKYAVRSAITTGNVPVLKILLKHKIDCDHEINDDVIFYAVCRGFLNVVEVLIEHGVNVDIRHKCGVTSFMLACQLGYCEVAKMLIRASTNIHVKMDKGVTYLHIAALMGLSEIVEELILHECALEAETEDGMTPLGYACLHKRDQVVKILLENKAECNKRLGHGTTCLMQAAFAGASKIVRYLLEYKANLEARDFNYRTTALMFASSEGHTETVELLCQSNAKTVNLQDEMGFNALMLAINHKHTDIVRTLLQYSADCNVYNKNGTNALILAAEVRRVDIVRLLLKYGSQMNATDNQGNNALMIASKNHSLEIVMELLEHDAKVNEFNKHGFTALMLASQSGSLSIVMLLVTRGADVNLSSNQQHNAISIAVAGNYTEIASFLICHGAYSDGVINIAIANGQEEISKLLLNSEKSVASLCSHKSALSTAAVFDKFKIFQTILEHGINTHPEQVKQIECLVLKNTGGGLSRHIEHVNSKCELSCSNADLSIAFCLAENMHCILLDLSLYSRTPEKSSIVLWFYLYQVLDNEPNEEIEGKCADFSSRIAKQSFSASVYIAPRKTDWKNIARSLCCLKQIQLSRIQKKTLITQEIKIHASNIMIEYSEMEAFDSFEFYVYQNCLHNMLIQNEENKSEVTDLLTHYKYGVITMKCVKEQNLLDIHSTMFSFPIVFNILKIFEIGSDIRPFALCLVESGIVTELTERYMQYTKIDLVTNNRSQMPVSFAGSIIKIFRNLAVFDESKKYFKDSGTIQVLKESFATSNFKIDIILLITQIDAQDGQLPKLSVGDITAYMGSISSCLWGSQVINWLNGLKLLAETCDSAKEQMVDYFSHFKDILNSNITEFHKPVMECLKVLSTSKVTNTHIVRHLELLEALDDLRTSNSYSIYASDAKEVLWKSSRESGQIPLLTLELFSVDFPVKFEITDQLGQGSFGTVFLVRDLEHPDLKKFVAKQIQIDNIKQTMEIIPFEANILLRAKHERIVEFHGYQMKNKSVFLFMQFIQMGSLASYIQKKGGLNEQKTSLFTKQILEGLNYLHQENILHLDIKGNNILLESEISVKIADFGLSKIVEKNNDPLDIAGGTVRYIAPEVIAGTLDTEYSSRADIWSVGCTVVEMITKKPPNASIPSPNALFMVGTNQDPLFTLPEYSSKELKDFLDKTFTKEPRERPSAEQLLQTDRFLLGNF